MVISDNKNFVFVSVPKTGTTKAETHFLKNIHDAEKTPTLQEGKKVFYSQLHKHSGIIDLSYFMENSYKTKFKVAFTRNPYERVVSWFSYFTQNKNKKEHFRNHKKFYGIKHLSGKFIDFVKYAPSWCFANSVSYMIDSYGSVEVDFIGRFENYRNDMNTICKKLEIPSIDENKYLNRSTHGAYTKYYCDESFEKVTKKMQLDLNYFNYDFG